MSVSAPKLVGVKVGVPALFNVSDFEEDSENVNEHAFFDLAATGNSLENFGQVENLVVNGNKIIGGNGRLRLMKEKGWQQFWGIPVEGSPAQLKTLSIALNKTGKNSDFNYMKLVASLQELEHDENPQLLQLTGFAEHELEPLLASEFHLPDSSDVEVREVSAKKEKSGRDLDSRGMTIQFSVLEKQTLDLAIQEIRGRREDFGISPSECLVEICKVYLKDEETTESS